MVYNQTELMRVRDVGDLFVYANGTTSGLLIGLLVVALFFIIVMSLRRGQFEWMDSLMASSFTCFVISAILSSAGLLNLYYALAFLCVLSLSALYTSVVPKSY